MRAMAGSHAATNHGRSAAVSSNSSKAISPHRVDYVRPIQLRTTKGRGHRAHKAFLAVFICLSTKAVHLGVVFDYTGEAFLAAFRQFTAQSPLRLRHQLRRGRRSASGVLYGQQSRAASDRRPVSERSNSMMLQSAVGTSFRWSLRGRCKVAQAPSPLRAGRSDANIRRDEHFPRADRSLPKFKTSSGPIR